MSKEPAKQIKFVDEEGSRATLNKIRADSDPTNWATFGYQNNDSGKGVLVIVGAGSGGLEEFRQSLADNQILYALLRIDEVIDNSTTVKFVFINWQGEKVKFMQKAKVTPHQGEINDFIGQKHVSITAEKLSEVSDEAIIQKVGDGSGSSSKVLNTVVASSGPVHFSHPSGQSTSQHTQQPAKQSFSSPAKPQESVAPKPQQSKPAASTPVKTIAGAASKDVQVPADKPAVVAIRDNGDPTDWALYGYEGTTNKLIAVGSGSGGLAEMQKSLTDDGIFYGYLRVFDTIDSTTQPRFVLIFWVGEKVKTIRKALIATHKGKVVDFIGQAHLTIDVSNFTELTIENVMERVQGSSGTKSNVREVSGNESTSFGH